jgi:drug/metabolite transporter (DMT)-like permease
MFQGLSDTTIRSRARMTQAPALRRLTAIVPAVAISRNRRRLSAMAALVLAGAIWGTSDVATKLALGALPPVALAALRFAVALAVLECLRRRAGQATQGGRPVAALGLVGVALFFLLQNTGLRWTGAADASLIQGAAPAVAALLAVRFLGERLTPRGLLGTGASLAGVAVVALATGDRPRLALGGDLLVLGSAACFAGFVVLGRRAFAAGPTPAVLAGAVRYALLALIPAAALELAILGPGTLRGVGPGDVALVLYLGIGCSALAYGLWGYALRHLDVCCAAVFDNVLPVIGMVAAALVLGERPTPGHVVGALLVVGGVWQVAAAPAAAAGGARPRTGPATEHPVASIATSEASA